MAPGDHHEDLPLLRVVLRFVSVGVAIGMMLLTTCIAFRCNTFMAGRVVALRCAEYSVTKRPVDAELVHADRMFLHLS